MVQAQMRAIGMDFTVRTVSSAQMLQIAAAPEGNYEAAWAIASGTPAADLLFSPEFAI